MPAELATALPGLTLLALSALRGVVTGLFRSAALLAARSRSAALLAALPRWASLLVGSPQVARVLRRRSARSALGSSLLAGGVAGALLASRRPLSACGLLVAAHSLVAGLLVVEPAAALPVGRPALPGALSAALSTSVLGTAVLPAHGLERGYTEQ